MIKYLSGSFKHIQISVDDAAERKSHQEILLFESYLNHKPLCYDNSIRFF